MAVRASNSFRRWDWTERGAGGDQPEIWEQRRYAASQPLEAMKPMKTADQPPGNMVIRLDDLPEEVRGRPKKITKDSSFP